MRSPFQLRCDAAWRADQDDRRAEELSFAARVLSEAGDLVEGRVTRLYAIHSPDADAVKIGVSRDPKARLATLQTATPNRLELVADIPATDLLEGLLHRHLAADRLTGEWFRCSARMLVVCEQLMHVGESERDLIRLGEVFDAARTVTWLREPADAAFAVLGAT